MWSTNREFPFSACSRAGYKHTRRWRMMGSSAPCDGGFNTACRLPASCANSCDPAHGWQTAWILSDVREWNTQALREFSPEPVRANPCAGAHMSGYAFHLPGGEATPRSRRPVPAMFLSDPADLEQLLSSQDASFRPVAVAIEGCGS